MSNHNVGDLQVWWIPQVPMKAFEVDVASIEEGSKILDVLARYDIFQYTNKIKRDCSCVGGLRRWCFDSGDGKPGWEDWVDTTTGENNPRVFLEKQSDEIKLLRDALHDCASALKYIRETHGELYGVGFDRALGKANALLK